MDEYPLQNEIPDEANPDPGELLDRFSAYARDCGLELYPAQEEAILALCEGQNVILNTPTGSGKSLVATALHYFSVARGRRSIYTCPVKALVNEKFLALCRVFGPDLVGMATGDASVNRDAPILCCTAEILSNQALREGAAAPVEDVIMDEFHYYADRDRGVAWQIPLLTLDYARFLLMSATFGDPTGFKKALDERTGRTTAVVTTHERPVPLEFHYKETPLQETLTELVFGGKAPVYLVHFTQRECAEQAQGLVSLDVCTKEERKAIAEELKGERFPSPYGKDMKRILSHGIGLHHAGLLPRYRLLVEKLAQKGLLKVVCGTDTLGVGVNIPIRTVVFTKLCKFDGEKTIILSARDFHQIAGRAGRKGFDDQGTVVVQAPEHVIANKQMEAKAQGDPKKLRKIKRKQPPQKGYKPWDQKTFDKLVASSPEPLESRFQVNHGMLINVLSREDGGCEAMRQLIRDAHETPARKERIRKEAFQLFRSLVERQIVDLVPKESGAGKAVQVNVDLQEGFSIFQALAIWLLDTIPMLDRDSEEFSVDLLTLVEAIVENPRPILRRQVDRRKSRIVAELKEKGVEYEERMEILDEVTYPKPHEEFIYDTFNQFRQQHPWVGADNIRPKSIAREMYEHFMSFDEYVRDYGLQRSEGLLLRYLSEVYKILIQTVPETYRDDGVWDVIAFFRAIVRQVDSSLVDEWERMKQPLAALEEEEPEEEPEADVTADTRGFTLLVRNEVFRIVRALAAARYEDALSATDRQKPDGGTWSPRDLEETMAQYAEDHGGIDVSRSRASEFLTIERGDGAWTVDQVLVDPDEANDWIVRLTVDLDRSRAEGTPVMRLDGVGEIGRDL